MNTRKEVPVALRDKWMHIQEKKAAGLEDKIQAIVKELPPETLTDSQKGLREFHMNVYIPKSRKKKDEGNFGHLHAKEDEDDEAADARLNQLVNAIKEEHSRTNRSRKKKGARNRVLKAPHKSEKPVPGLPSAGSGLGGDSD